MTIDATSPDLHPGVAILAPLLGTWTGEGSGEYPTIEPFGYRETITFGHVGKPFVAYEQRTSSVGEPGGLPMHAERGYWRIPAEGFAEIVMVHPTGITEVLEGFAAPNSPMATDTLIVDVRSSSIAATATAKEVVKTERTFEITGDTLRYTVRMAAVGQPLQHHLAAILHRS